MEVQVINNEGTSLEAQVAKNPPAMQESQIQSLVGKIPWRREPNLLPRWLKNLPANAGGMGWSLTGYSPWGRKELDTTEYVHAHVCVRTHTHTHTHPTQMIGLTVGGEVKGQV